MLLAGLHVAESFQSWSYVTHPFPPRLAFPRVGSSKSHSLNAFLKPQVTAKFESCPAYLASLLPHTRHLTQVNTSFLKEFMFVPQIPKGSYKEKE